MNTQLKQRALVVATAVSLVAAACTGGGNPRPSIAALTPTSTPASTQSPSTVICPTRSGPVVPEGGAVVFGAEQWPDCLNPITSCAASNWTFFTVLEHVLPRAMQLDAAGTFIASPMLIEAPSLANGELSVNPFTVRFRISPAAVWADKSPITSADFAFTWRAILNTTGARDTSGYDLIASIDSADPKTAVITFVDVYADWPDLFGGARGFVLEEAAFPRFAGKPNPDLGHEMATEIPFSGGPFILQSWSPDQAVLVRNDHYFGVVACLYQLMFVPRTDPTVEIQSLLVGEIAAVYPDVSGAIGLFRLEDAPPLSVVGGNGTFFEALWFNNTRPPLNDAAVREALMYAIDRQAVVDTVVKLNNPDAEVLNCGFLALPNLGPWCETKPFEQFTYSPERAKAILESDGYDCSANPCTKNGKRLEVGYDDVSVTPRRTATEVLLIPKALDAGFDLTVVRREGGAQFSDVGPHGAFTMVDSTQAASPDPSVTALLACDGIPTSENGLVGNNWIRWCDQGATALMNASDAELDPLKRLDDMNQIYALEARDFISLPLYVIPAVSAWRTDQIAGPIGLYNSSPYGLFFNMNEWYVAPLQVTTLPVP
jgi:peptide/nickel transport system substrate-binding protein